MRYRVERQAGQRCLIMDNRAELLEYLKHTPPETITDIRKIYKNGITDSVMETYFPYGGYRSRRERTVGRIVSVPPNPK